VPTEALTILIERDAADLDLYADLSGEGADVQGVTELAAGARPSVKIARELTLQRWRATTWSTGWSGRRATYRGRR
jgi:hypothetical protein